MENKEPKYIGRVLDLAMKAGTMLLKSGAEVRRVEEVIVRIAGVFDVKVEKTCYSLTNGLFVSYTDEDGNSYAKVYQEEIGSSRFNHLIEVNQFSRDLAREKWTLDEAEKRLETIANKKDTSLILRGVAALLAAFAFTIMFHGSVLDAVISGMIGIATFLVSMLLSTRLSKIVAHVVGGLTMAVLTLIAIVAFKDCVSPTIIITGAMMPLVPGIAFANGVRDIGNSDYLSGVTRLLDALMVFVSIAIGMAILTWIVPSANFLTLQETKAIWTDALWVQAIFAALATGTFAIIFQTPGKYLWACCLTGLLSWVVYYIHVDIGSVALASLVSTLVLSLCSRIFAVRLKAPMSIFLVPGLIPTVPGAKLLFTFYGLLSGEMRLGAINGLEAMEILIGIVIGITLINVIPQKWFQKLLRKE